MQGRLGRVFSRLVTRRLLPPCCMCLLAGRAGARVSLPCLARSPGRFWGDLGGCARGCARILLSAPHSMCGHTLLDGAFSEGSFVLIARTPDGHPSPSAPRRVFRCLKLITRLGDQVVGRSGDQVIR